MKAAIAIFAVIIPTWIWDTFAEPNNYNNTG